MLELQKNVSDAIRLRKLFRARERVLVAVSGGADSIALLHLLSDLAEQWGGQLWVAHFNHQLRGRESDWDEAFVRRSARKLKLPIRVGRGDVRQFAARHGISIEMAARQLRHEFLAKAALGAKCAAVALAHHADDQVELFFLRLLRGAGTDGLAGMKWSAGSPVDPRIRLVRPLLSVNKSDLEAYLTERGLAFRADASNGSREILRNRLRLELLPQLREDYQPAVCRTVLRLMEVIGGEAEVVTQIARDWLDAKWTEKWGRLPVAIQRRVIQIQVQEIGVDVDFELVEWLREFEGKRVSVGKDDFLVRDSHGKVLRSAKPDFSSAEHRLKFNLNSSSGGTVSFGGVALRWSFGRGQSGKRPVFAAGNESFDAERVGKHVLLRHWRPGDRFQPIGMKTAVKLQDWFTNQKIPVTRRRELVIATAESGEIFWVEGLRIGERFKLTPQTRRVLSWQWGPEKHGSPALRG